MNISERQSNFLIGIAQLSWLALIVWLAYETVNIANPRGIP